MKIKQQLISMLCAVSSVMMVGGIRTAEFFPGEGTAIAAVAPESGVQLYTEANYLGINLLFSPGRTYNVVLTPEYKNRISSLKVPEGFVVTLVDRESNRSQSFGAGNHQVIDESINNKADVVIVTAK